VELLEYDYVSNRRLDAFELTNACPPYSTYRYSMYGAYHRPTPTKKWGVEQVNIQSPQLSQRDDL